MTGREKPKRKALHRGLDDIVRRDASLTSRLLGRVKPIAREPLDPPPISESATAVPSSDAVTPLAAGDESNSQRQTTHDARPPSPPATRFATRKTLPLTEESASTFKSEASHPNLASPPIQADLPGERAIQSSVDIRILSYRAFVERWGFFLKSGNRTGKLRICEVLYRNTYAVGEETYFTSYEKLAKLAGLEKKQCAINIRQLEELGFVQRLNIFNTATRQGTEFKLHLAQLSPQDRKSPRYHHYDEDD